VAISNRRSALIAFARDGPPRNPPLRADSLRSSDAALPANAAHAVRNARTFRPTQPPPN